MDQAGEEMVDKCSLLSVGFLSAKITLRASRYSMADTDNLEWENRIEKCNHILNLVIVYGDV